MSFTKTVKNELLEHKDRPKHCRTAEAMGMVLFSKNKGTDLAGKIDIDKTDISDLKSLADDLSDDRIKKIVQKTCCKRSFLRGAFLAAGSVSSPSGLYHFEFSASDKEKACFIQDIMTFFGLHGKISERKGKYVVYLKDADEISEALNIMEAQLSMMEFENARILKSVRNDINRKVNCEAANIQKTVAAASKQLEDISFISDTVGLDALNEQLREVAALRLRYPEKSLAELGELAMPKLGRSGVNHRMEKIGAFAEELRESSGRSSKESRRK